MEKELTF